MKNNMTQQYLCKSFVDDNGILRDCICDKCGMNPTMPDNTQEEKCEHSFEGDCCERCAFPFAEEDGICKHSAVCIKCPCHTPPNKQPEAWVVDEFNKKLKLGRDVGESEEAAISSGFIDAWDKYDDEINDCPMTSQDRKVMRLLLGLALTSQRASDVRKLEEAIPKCGEWDSGVTAEQLQYHYGFNEAIDQAIALLKDNK